MAKRINLGSLVNNKDPSKPRYIKVNIKEAVTLNPGDYIRFETKQQQLASLDEALEAGRLDEATVEKMKARAEKIPDFVLAEAILNKA